MTVSAFLDEWLPADADGRRPSTHATYETVVNRYMTKHIGSLHLQAITPLTLQTLYADLLATGQANGKDGLSPATVRYVHAVLRKALKDAVRSTSSSATSRIVARRASRVRRSVPGQREKCARSSTTCEMTGSTPRMCSLHDRDASRRSTRSEMAGRRLDAGRVSVSQTLVVVSSYEVQFSEPKTARGRRLVALDETTAKR